MYMRMTHQIRDLHLDPVYTFQFGLQQKLTKLSVVTTYWLWITNSLTNRQQLVMGLGNITDPTPDSLWRRPLQMLHFVYQERSTWTKNSLLSFTLFTSVILGSACRPNWTQDYNRQSRLMRSSFVLTCSPFRIGTPDLSINP